MSNGAEAEKGKKKKREYCVSMWRNVWKTEQPLSLLFFFFDEIKKNRTLDNIIERIRQVTLACEHNDKISQNAYRFTWFCSFDIAIEYSKTKKNIYSNHVKYKEKYRSEHTIKRISLIDPNSTSRTRIFYIYKIPYKYIWSVFNTLCCMEQCECSQSNVKAEKIIGGER